MVKLRAYANIFVWVERNQVSVLLGKCETVHQRKAGLQAKEDIRKLTIHELINYHSYYSNILDRLRTAR